MTWTVQLTNDGHRNVSLLVKGMFDTYSQDADPVELINIKAMSPTPPKGLKLTGAWWLIEGTAGIRLWWGKEAIPHQWLLLPLEGRGNLKLDDGLSSPEGWDGSLGFTYVCGPSPRMFTLQMDFDKQ